VFTESGLYSFTVEFERKEKTFSKDLLSFAVSSLMDNMNDEDFFDEIEGIAERSHHKKCSERSCSTPKTSRKKTPHVCIQFHFHHSHFRFKKNDVQILI
jgi:hypothetical protein